MLIVLALALVLLAFYHPGGVRHAPRVTSRTKGKGSIEAEIDIKRERVEVAAANVRLTHIDIHLPSFKRIEKTILANVSALFPGGKLSIIMGPSGSGKSTFLRMCAGRPMKAGLFGTLHGSGEILFNGTPASKHNGRLCAFVEQGTE